MQGSLVSKGSREIEGRSSLLVGNVSIFPDWEVHGVNKVRLYPVDTTVKIPIGKGFVGAFTRFDIFNEPEKVWGEAFVRLGRLLRITGDPKLITLESSEVK